MKERCRENFTVFSVQWPPLPIKKAFNLAMIQQPKIQRGKIPDEYVRMTIAGKVDDILHMKTPVKLENIFRVDEEDRKVVLVEGAPGSGKSTLSWDICKGWGAGELFQEYEVVILVRLRDPKVQAATTLANLLPAKDDTMAESVASQIAACEGEKSLLERVEENPVVASSCCLPLNAAIFVHLFLSGNQALPTTVHGIFTSLVLCCLSRYQTERL